MKFANEITEEIETECCFLNSFGDISVKWKEKDNKEFIAEIDELIKSGYTFFILKKDKNKKKVKTKVKDTDMIEKRRILVEREKDLKPLLSLGKNVKVEYIEVPGEIDTEGIARSGKEVIGKKTIAVKPAVGG